VAKHEISRPFVLDYINRRRVFFPFVTPNTLAGYLIMILPLAFIQKKTSWFALPVFAALLLTQSLGSIFSIFVAALIVSILRGKMKGKIFYLAALAAAAGIVFLLRAELGEEHFRPAFSTLMRLNYWKETLQIIKLHPFLGIGPGNLNLTYSRYAHNSYLQLWAETGISGIIAFLWLIITMLKLGFKDINAGQAKAQTAYLLCAILAFIIHNFMDFTFFLPEVSLIWWAILGCLSSCHLPKQRQAQRPQ
jgi:O-antigen ligase